MPGQLPDVLAPDDAWEAEKKWQQPLDHWMPWVYFNLGFRVSGRGVRAHRIPYRIKKGRSSRSSYFIFGTGQALAARLELL